MQTRQLYASVTASIAGSVYVELPTNAKIKAVDMWITPIGAMSATADSIIAEVSTVSSNQTATNDAVGVLATCGANYTIVTSGAAVAGIGRQCLCDVQCKAGDRIYLNATESGTTTWNVRAVIHFS